MPFAKGDGARPGGRAESGRLVIAAGPGFLRDGERHLEELAGHNPNLPQERTESKAAAGYAARLTVYLRLEENGRWKREDGKGGEK